MPCCLHPHSHLFTFGVGVFCVFCFLHVHWHLCSYFNFIIAENLGALCSWCAPAHFHCKLLYSTSPAHEDCASMLPYLPVEGSFLVPFMRAFVSTKHKMFVWHRAHTRYLSPLHSSLSICPFGACLVHVHLKCLPHLPHITPTLRWEPVVALPSHICC